jgi:hypothetical protein
MRLVFWCLILGIVAMASWLAYERHRGRERIRNIAETVALDAPSTNAQSETVTLEIPNDADGTLQAVQRTIALPAEPTARARALIDHLIAECAQPGSTHPLTAGIAVNEVFLVPLPITGYTNGTENKPSRGSSNGELAVIDLRSSFVNNHPSGVEVEVLTLCSMLATLHANLPEITAVRFLVDGQQRETLAGHVDLQRTYPIATVTTSDSTL